MLPRAPQEFFASRKWARAFNGAGVSHLDLEADLRQRFWWLARLHPKDGFPHGKPKATDLELVFPKNRRVAQYARKLVILQNIVVAPVEKYWLPTLWLSQILLEALVRSLRTCKPRKLSVDNHDHGKSFGSGGQL